MPPRLSTRDVSPGRAEQRAVERRHQRRALAAGGHVAAAEVGHHVDAARSASSAGR